jgi:hypothetical protein
MKKARSFSSHPCKTPSRLEGVNRTVVSSFMPCQKVSRNYEQLYREDHRVNRQYQNDLLVKISNYERAASHSQMHYDQLATKYDNLAKQFHSNLKFTSSILKKLQVSIRKNKTFKKKFEEVENIKGALIDSVRNNQVEFKEADQAFYEQKIDELRNLYRSSLGHSSLLEPLAMNTKSKSTLAGVYSPDRLAKNRDFLSTKDDFFDRTAQSSLGFRQSNANLIASKGRISNQMTSIKSQIQLIEDQLSHMKGKIQRQV